MPKNIKCPICERQMQVAWGDKMMSDAEIQRKIDLHLRGHTVGEIASFCEESFADQLNKIEEELASKESQEKQRDYE